MSARLTIYHELAQSEAKKLSIPERTKIAGMIASDASAFAPVLTGEYSSSFSVESGGQVRVVSNDDTAIHKEYGTSDTPAHAALTEAAMQYGKYSGTMPRGAR